jgi:type II secretory pathway predicted ATPase ExeA
MFQEYYGFTRAPFAKTIETDKLFATVGQKELTARLTYLVRERGCGLVTGEIGSGKSTAVRAFTNPTTGSMGLYRELLLTLGHEPPFSKPRMVSRIRTALADLRINKRRTPLVIIDEAHLLTQPMLEELRLLFSDKMDSESLATLVLVGHPDLRRTLHLSVNEAFYQRLAMRYHLGSLDLQETIGYVRHHVKVAGYNAGQLFTDDAITRIFEYTKGLPRRINQLCHTALMAGLIDQKSTLDESTIRKAIADIEHD